MSNRFKWFCKRFCQPARYQMQVSTVRITLGDVRKLFAAHDNLEIDDLHLTDRNFKLVDIEHLRRYLRENPVSERKYVPGKFDCDDFAYVLMGDITRWDSDLCVGIIHGKREGGTMHAWNVCIGTDYKIYFIEPQSDKVWIAEGTYAIGFIVI